MSTFFRCILKVSNVFTLNFCPLVFSCIMFHSASCREGQSPERHHEMDLLSNETSTFLYLPSLAAKHSDTGTSGLLPSFFIIQNLIDSYFI